MPIPKFPILVPSGRQESFSTFYADSFEPIWQDGTIGTVTLTYTPNVERKKELIKNIDQAEKMIKSYLESLEVARKLLTDGKN